MDLYVLMRFQFCVFELMAVFDCDNVFRIDICIPVLFLSMDVWMIYYIILRDVQIGLGGIEARPIAFGWNQKLDYDSDVLMDSTFYESVATLNMNQLSLFLYQYNCDYRTIDNVDFSSMHILTLMYLL